MSNVQPGTSNVQVGTAPDIPALKSMARYKYLARALTWTLDVPGWTLDIKEKSPSAVAAEEDIPKTDYIFISSAVRRDKFKLISPFGARHSVVFLKKPAEREGLRIFFALLAGGLKGKLAILMQK